MFFRKEHCGLRPSIAVSCHQAGLDAAPEERAQILELI